MASKGSEESTFWLTKPELQALLSSHEPSKINNKTTGNGKYAHEIHNDHNGDLLSKSLLDSFRGHSCHAQLLTNQNNGSACDPCNLNAYQYEPLHDLLIRGPTSPSADFEISSSDLNRPSLEANGTNRPVARANSLKCLHHYDRASMLNHHCASEVVRDQINSNNPMITSGRPQDIAEDKSSRITRLELSEVKTSAIATPVRRIGSSMKRAYSYEQPDYRRDHAYATKLGPSVSKIPSLPRTKMQTVTFDSLPLLFITSLIILIVHHASNVSTTTSRTDNIRFNLTTPPFSKLHSLNPTTTSDNHYTNNNNNHWSINKGDQLLAINNRSSKRLLPKEYFTYLYQQNDISNGSFSNKYNINYDIATSLGDPCLVSSQCQRGQLRGAHCERDTATCSCLPYHVQLNASICLPAALLGDKCQLDSQCQMKVANSHCDNGSCRCLSHHQKFISLRKDKCLPGAKLNDYCVSDEHCRLEDVHAHCKWHIPRVYGLCKCPANYRHLEVTFQDPNNNQTRRKVKCAPRLGDSCMSSNECHWTNPEWVCREPSNELEMSALKWKSSNASPKRCLCKEIGFAYGISNKLDCANSQQLTKDNFAISSAVHSAYSLASDDSMNSRNEYQLIQHQAHTTPQPPAQTSTTSSIKKTSNTNVNINDDINISPASISEQPSLSIHQLSGQRTDFVNNNGVTPTNKNNLNQNISMLDVKSSAQASTIKPTSLGKPCSSSADCKARDPNSACISGVCECSHPSDRCRASSTGCHKDTFQCRSSGLCISWYFVCDQFNNCDDGSDEEFCFGMTTNSTANLSRFGLNSNQNRLTTMNDGSTIASPIDSIIDSDHKSGQGRPFDSAGNSKPTTMIKMTTAQQNKLANCPVEAFKCNDGSGCLSRSKMCNGESECVDGSDELGCVRTSTSDEDRKNDADNNGTKIAANSFRCPQGTFECANGQQCLPSYVFCNSVSDCSDSSDERWDLCDRLNTNNNNWFPNNDNDHNLAKHQNPTTDQQSSQHAKGTANSATLHKPHPLGGHSASGSIVSGSSMGANANDARVAVASHQATHSSSGEPPNSPLVKADRVSIEKLLALVHRNRLNQTKQKSPNLSAAQTPPRNSGRISWTTQSVDLASAKSNIISSHVSGSISQPSRPGRTQQQQRINLQQRDGAAPVSLASPDHAECPAWAFTCRNGRCRSSAVLCSGVDGCGDNSDEYRCEVCRCEAPHSG